MRSAFIGFAIVALLPAFALAQSNVCPSLTRTLSYGSRGSNVTSLQNFLVSQSFLTAGNNTGYFGKLTEAAVRSWQKKNGIISNGTPATTGYGAVGPRTRTAILKICDGTVTSAVPIIPTYVQSSYGSGYSQGSYGGYVQGSYYSQSSYATTSYSQGSYYAQGSYYSQGTYAPTSHSGATNLKTDYGAKGDGTTDDTAAWKAALSEANDSVYIPAGTYLISDTGTIAHTKTVSGDGSSSHLKFLQSGATPKTFLLFAPGSSGSTLKNLYIDYDAPGSPRGSDILGGDIILASGGSGAVSNVTIDSVEIYGHGAQMSGITLNYVEGAQITHNYVHDIYGMGITASAASNIAITGNKIERYHIWAGIWCNSVASNILIDGNTVNDIDGYQSAGTGIACRGRLSNVTITNNKYYGFPKDNTINSGILLFDADHSTVSNNYVKGSAEAYSIADSTNIINTYNIAEGPGVEGLDGCNPGDTIAHNRYYGQGSMQIGVNCDIGPIYGRIDISDNTIVGFTSYGIAVKGSADDISIHDNNILFDPSATNGQAGILVSNNSVGMYILNNVIDGYAQNARYGIYWLASSAGDIESNQIRNFYVDGILIEPSGTTVDRLTVRGNSFGNIRVQNIEQATNGPYGNVSITE